MEPPDLEEARSLDEALKAPVAHRAGKRLPADQEAELREAPQCAARKVAPRREALWRVREEQRLVLLV